MVSGDHDGSETGCVTAGLYVVLVFDDDAVFDVRGHWEISSETLLEIICSCDGIHTWLPACGSELSGMVFADLDQKEAMTIDLLLYEVM